MIEERETAGIYQESDSELQDYFDRKKKHGVEMN